MKEKTPLNELSNKELELLAKEGHIVEKTKEIAELTFFYNAVSEEVKRRKLKEKEKK